MYFLYRCLFDGPPPTYLRAGLEEEPTSEALYTGKASHSLRALAPPRSPQQQNAVNGWSREDSKRKPPRMRTIGRWVGARVIQQQRRRRRQQQQQQKQRGGG